MQFFYDNKTVVAYYFHQLFKLMLVYLLSTLNMHAFFLHMNEDGQFWEEKQKTKQFSPLSQMAKPCVIARDHFKSSDH